MFGRFLIGAVRLYQAAISSWTPPACRFTPTCSAYAIEAIGKHGPARGAWLAFRRVGRCQPWGGHGFDAVPPRDREGTPTDVVQPTAQAERVST